MGTKTKAINHALHIINDGLYDLIEDKEFLTPNERKKFKSLIKYMEKLWKRLENEN